LATQAPNNATDSAMGRRSQEVCRIVRVMAKTSGDSGPGVSTNIFGRIHESFTTQVTGPKRPESTDFQVPSPGRDLAAGGHRQPYCPPGVSEV
jgi:hypothetical protein